MSHCFKLLAHMIADFLVGAIVEAVIQTRSDFLVVGNIHRPNIAPFRKNSADDEASIASLFQYFWVFGNGIVDCPPTGSAFRHELVQQDGNIDSAEESIPAYQFCLENLFGDFLLENLFQFPSADNAKFFFYAPPDSSFKIRVALLRSWFMSPASEPSLFSLAS